MLCYVMLGRDDTYNTAWVGEVRAELVCDGRSFKVEGAAENCVHISDVPHMPFKYGQSYVAHK